MTTEEHKEHDKESEKNIVDIVEKHGWFVGLINGTDYLPTFGYTIGLWKTFKHPELICFGLTGTTIHQVLNIGGEKIKKGERLAPDKRYDDFFEQGPAQFINVEKGTSMLIGKGLLSLCFSTLILFLLHVNGNAQQMNDTMRHTKIKGISIAFQQAGTGPALVLLHGGANTNSRMWKPQFKSLSENFTVIAWDAPGAGLSDDPPESFKMNDWADYLAGFLDSIGYKKAHILGLSWGSVLAQVFYQRHPNYVVSLILCGAYTGWKSSLSDSIANERLTAALHDITLPPKEFASKYLPSMFSDAAPQEVKEELSNIMSSNFHPVGCRLIFTTMVEVDTKMVLPTIKVPTLLIWGEADKRSPLSVAREFHDAIPNSKLEIILHAGHLSNMEKPEQFNKVVKDFCLAVALKK